MTLPADSHVHSEWSWDAPLGSMERTCERARHLGVPAVAFTEHLDHTTWPAPTEGPYASEFLTSLAGSDGMIAHPPFDAAGYLTAVAHCRDRFSDLHILSGLELGEPHWYVAEYAAVLATGPFDRVLGSLHCLPDGTGYAEPWALYPHRDAAGVVREYLAEVVRLVASTAPFSVLAHIDYPVRHWPAPTAGPFDPTAFEDEFRHALRTTAASGRALEINTRLPLDATILRWWHDEGGDAVTFGSDAHQPRDLAHGFADAAAMAEAHGFRPGPTPHALWPRAP